MRKLKNFPIFWAGPEFQFGSVGTPGQVGPYSSSKMGRFLKFLSSMNFNFTVPSVYFPPPANQQLTNPSNNVPHTNNSHTTIAMRRFTKTPSSRRAEHSRVGPSTAPQSDSTSVASEGREAQHEGREARKRPGVPIRKHHFTAIKGRGRAPRPSRSIQKAMVRPEKRGRISYKEGLRLARERRHALTSTLATMASQHEKDKDLEGHGDHDSDEEITRRDDQDMNLRYTGLEAPSGEENGKTSSSSSYDYVSRGGDGVGTRDSVSNDNDIEEMPSNPLATWGSALHELENCNLHLPPTQQKMLRTVIFEKDGSKVLDAGDFGSVPLQKTVTHPPSVFQDQMADRHDKNSDLGPKYAPFDNFTQFMLTVLHILMPFSKLQYNAIKAVFTHDLFCPADMPVNYEHLQSNLDSLPTREVVSMLVPKGNDEAKSKKKVNKKKKKKIRRKKRGVTGPVSLGDDDAQVENPNAPESVSIPNSVVPFHSFHFLDSLQRLLHKPGILNNFMAHPRFDDRPPKELWHGRQWRENPLFNKYEMLPSGLRLGDFLIVQDREVHSLNRKGDRTWVAQLISIYEDARESVMNTHNGQSVLKFEVRLLFDRAYVMAQGHRGLFVNGLRSVDGKLNYFDEHGFGADARGAAGAGADADDDDSEVVLHITDRDQLIPEDASSEESGANSNHSFSGDDDLPSALQDVPQGQYPNHASRNGEVKSKKFNRRRVMDRKGVKDAIKDTSDEHEAVMKLFRDTPVSLKRYELFYSDVILHGFTEDDIVDGDFAKKLAQEGHDAFDSSIHTYFINSYVAVAVRHELPGLEDGNVRNKQPKVSLRLQSISRTYQPMSKLIVTKRKPRPEYIPESRELKIFLDLYSDGFPVLHRIHHTITGVYVTIGNLPRPIRFGEDNMLLVALIPKDADKQVSMTPFLNTVHHMEQGLEMEIFGDKWWIIGGCGSIRMDLVELPDFCPCKSHNADFGCRGCQNHLIERNDMRFNVKSARKTRDLVDTVLKKLVRENKVKSDGILSESEDSDEMDGSGSGRRTYRDIPELFNHDKGVSKKDGWQFHRLSIDYARTFPVEPFHSEIMRFIRTSLECLYEKTLSSKGREALAALLKDKSILPPGFPKFRPLSHFKQWIATDLRKLTVVTPYILRKICNSVENFKKDTVFASKNFEGEEARELLEKFWCELLPKSILLTNGDFHLFNVNEMSRQEYLITLLKTESIIIETRETFIKLYNEVTLDMAVLHLGLHIVGTKEDYQSGSNIQVAQDEFCHLRFKKAARHCNMQDVTGTLLKKERYSEALRFYVSGACGHMMGSEYYPSEGVIAAVMDKRLSRIFSRIYLGAEYEVDEEKLSDIIVYQRESRDESGVQSDAGIHSRPRGTDSMNGMRLRTGIAHGSQQFEGEGATFNAIKYNTFYSMRDTGNLNGCVNPYGYRMKLFNKFDNDEMVAIRDMLSSFDYSFRSSKVIYPGSEIAVPIPMSDWKHVSVVKEIKKRDLAPYGGEYVLRPEFFEKFYIAPAKKIYRGFTHGLGSYGRKAALTIGDDVAVQYLGFDDGKPETHFAKVLMPMQVYLEPIPGCEPVDGRSAVHVFDPVTVLRVLWYTRLDEGRSIRNHSVYRLNTTERDLTPAERYTMVSKVIQAVDMKHACIMKSTQCEGGNHHDGGEAAKEFLLNPYFALDENAINVFNANS